MYMLYIQLYKTHIHSFTVIWLYVYFVHMYIYMVSFRVPKVLHPPHGMGPQVAPLPFYLQAIGSISEVQPRIS